MGGQPRTAVHNDCVVKLLFIQPVIMNHNDLHPQTLELDEETLPTQGLHCFFYQDGEFFIVFLLFMMLFLMLHAISRLSVFSGLSLFEILLSGVSFHIFCFLLCPVTPISPLVFGSNPLSSSIILIQYKTPAFRHRTANLLRPFLWFEQCCVSVPTCEPT